MYIYLCIFLDIYEIIKYQFIFARMENILLIIVALIEWIDNKKKN